MRAAVTAALEEGEMLGVLDGRGLGEAADRLGQQVSEVGDLDAPGDLRLWQRLFRSALGVNDRLFLFYLLPLEALLRAGDVEALAVLAGDVEQTARDLGDHVAAGDLERRRLDRERAVVTLDQLLADAARTVADDALGQGDAARLAQDRQTRTDAVGGVVHRRQAGPVVGPAVHVLLMAAAQELNAAQFALVVQVLGEKVLAGIDDGLHHHVDLAGLAA